MPIPVAGGMPIIRNPWFTVIGVAKDVKQWGVDQTVRPEVYVLVDQVASDPVAQVETGPPMIWVAFSPTTMHVVARTTLPLATLAPAIARVVRDVDPTVPVARLREMDEVLNESIERPRLLAQLLTLFSALALLLAAIGTYGVLAYMVTERRLEIGIRLALGAARRSVLRQVMGQGMKLTVIGVIAGLAGALALNRLIASLLFGVQPTDAPTLAAVIATITLGGRTRLLAASVACVAPQPERRAPSGLVEIDFRRHSKGAARSWSVAHFVLLGVSDMRAIPVSQETPVTCPLVGHDVR